MAIQFTIEYPIGAGGYDPDLLCPDGLHRVVTAVDELGFDAIAFTEHPAPSQKWLEAGGHESLDVIGALSFHAAVTSRVRLMTYLLVLPYRNPLLAAKGLDTVDVLSGGRTTAVVGSGHMRSEFRALQGDGAAVAVQVQSPQSQCLRTGDAVEEHLDHLGQRADAGVGWFVLQPPSGSVQECLDGLARYRETVLPPAGTPPRDDKSRPVGGTSA